MRLRAPAKINLHLRVGPARPDGFHPLVSWMTTISLFDTLEFQSTHSHGVMLRCDDPALPTDETNLVMKAARALVSGLAPQRQHSLGGVEITLHKRIPSQAGLGGGSSDARAALVGLNRLWQLDLTSQQLAEIGAQLGSDVAFFQHGPSSVCTSRGEIVRSIPVPKAKWAALILPSIRLSTPLVYRRFDELNREVEWDDQPAWHQWAQLSARLLLPRLINDLEPAAFSLEPKLALLREQIERIIDRPVKMSGSGSSLFTLFDEQKEAQDAAARIGSEASVVSHAVEIAPQIKEEPTEQTK
jgi:4-diphosphocytidyl-2-C-methyl-D-erythritol kinase